MFVKAFSMFLNSVQLSEVAVKVGAYVVNLGDCAGKIVGFFLVGFKVAELILGFVHS